MASFFRSASKTVEAPDGAGTPTGVPYFGPDKTKPWTEQDLWHHAYYPKPDGGFDHHYDTDYFQWLRHFVFYHGPWLELGFLFVLALGIVLIPLTLILAYASYYGDGEEVVGEGQRLMSEDENVAEGGGSLSEAEKQVKETTEMFANGGDIVGMTGALLAGQVSADGMRSRRTNAQGEE